MKRVGILLFVENEGCRNVLLVRESSHDDKIGTIGGKPERGESDLDTCIRECYEETSQTINLTPMRHELANTYTVIDTAVKYFFLNIKMNVRRFFSRKIPANEEIEELQLWNIDSLRQAYRDSSSTFDFGFGKVVEEINNYIELCEQ